MDPLRREERRVLQEPGLNARVRLWPDLSSVGVSLYLYRRRSGSSLSGCSGSLHERVAAGPGPRRAQRQRARWGGPSDRTRAPFPPKSLGPLSPRCLAGICRRSSHRRTGLGHGPGEAPVPVFCSSSGTLHARVVRRQGDPRPSRFSCEGRGKTTRQDPRPRPPGQLLDDRQLPRLLAELGRFGRGRQVALEHRQFLRGGGDDLPGDREDRLRRRFLRLL